MRSRTGFVSWATASLHRMSPAAAPDTLSPLDAYRADHDVAALIARLEGLDAAGSLLTTAAPGRVLSALRAQEDLRWSLLPLVVACHLPSTPAQVAGRLADAFLTGADGDLVGAYARRRMEGRGREWCAELAWSAPLIAADPPWLSGLLGSDRMLIEADRPSEAAERLYAQLVAVGFDLGAASVARTVYTTQQDGVRH